MKMDVLHCKTVLGVLKELTIFAIVYNLVRLVILQSAQHQQVEVDRMSFLDALRWLGVSAAAPPHMRKEQGQPAPFLLSS
jgi:hypothetical protein